MKSITKIIALATLFASAVVNAAPITDVQDHSSNTASEYFVDIDANKYDDPYYRGASEDWSWTHTAIAGSFSSIILNISAFDVDTPQEMDTISVFDGSTWVILGDLVGRNNQWDFTEFDLSGFAWANDQVNAGLQVNVDIDSANTGWLVTLGKATLSLDGGNQQCVPTPGFPCVAEVPEPAYLFALGLGLMGLQLRRKSK